MVSLPAHGHIGEIELAFGNGTDVHPLRGLTRYGPYSSSFFRKKTLRLAVITIENNNKLDQFISNLDSSFSAQERKEYVVDYTGFKNIFGLDIEVTHKHELPSDFTQKLQENSDPLSLLRDNLVDAINSAKANRHNYDVLVLFIPKEWEDYTRERPTDKYLHDYLKGICAENSLPLQILREASALSYPCKASVFWRLSIALYTKTGGTPWKVANYDQDKAYIGISYAMKKNEEGETDYVTCCSQMFAPDGTGFEFVAYDVAEDGYETDRRENPFLKKDEMFKVMTRSLNLYQDRHNGASLKKVTIHKQTHFTQEEIEGCIEAFPPSTEVELIQIKHTDWSGTNIPHKLSKESDLKKSLAWPCERGSYLPLGEDETLLWVQGNVSGKGKISDWPNYYKEQMWTPQPLLIKRFVGTGGWHDPCRGILALSKMDWNNDALYSSHPVTLSYSSMLARVIKSIPTLTRQTYQYLLFM
jgi:hypothetical protein